MEVNNISVDEVEAEIRRYQSEGVHPQALSAKLEETKMENSVRTQVIEVIVRQAIAGADWRLICAGAMQANHITSEEIEAEVLRRQNGGAGGSMVPPHKKT